MFDKMRCISIIVLLRSWKKFDNKRMKLRRWILLGLLVIAVGIMAAYFIWPRYEWELLCYVFSIPVIVICGWEWLEEPEFMEKIVGVFRKKEKSTISTKNYEGDIEI